MDIGAGPGDHAAFMRAASRKVITLDAHAGADLMGTWPEAFQRVDPDLVDAVWCCHTLEHSPDPGVFLQAILALRPTVVAITVPPAKHNLVGGHLTLWNEGLLLYNLVRAGFDCHRARVGVYGYNISVILAPVWRREAVALVDDAGDLETLAPWFPCGVRQDMDGRVGSIRW